MVPASCEFPQQVGDITCLDVWTQRPRRKNSEIAIRAKSVAKGQMEIDADRAVVENDVVRERPGRNRLHIRSQPIYTALRFCPQPQLPSLPRLFSGDSSGS